MSQRRLRHVQAVRVRARSRACFILFILIALHAAPAHAGVSLAPPATVPFEENAGQFDPQVAFAAQTFGGTVFVTHDGRMVYALPGDGSVGAHGRAPLPPVAPAFGLALYETLVGATSRGVRGVDPAITRVSYFKGNDPKQWLSGLPTYHRLDFGEVYPGIRLELIAHGNNVEKRFIVAPGAQPEMIRIRVEGAQALQTNAVDELELTTELGPVGFTAPIAYQPGGEPVGAIHESPLPPVAPMGVAVVYDVSGDEYGFAIGRYDRSRPLIIDPLLASTLFGSSLASSRSFAIALNDQGQVYIAGKGGGSDFPTTPGVYQEISPGNWDVFISKFSNDMRYLLASTFLGGSDTDLATSALTIDGNGNVVVGGWTFSSNFPITPGAIGQSDIGAMDGFVAKLDSDLTTLLASTYLSGSQDETVVAVAGDEFGQVYATGWTTSPNFPAVPFPPGAFDATFDGGYDAFVLRLNDTFTELQGATFLSGGGNEKGRDIVRDPAGNVYVTGCGAGDGFPTTPGAYDQTGNGAGDVFVSKLDPDLATLQASTLFGGNDTDCVGPAYTLNQDWYSSPLALDVGGRVLIGGFTYSVNFPTTPGAFCPEFSPTAYRQGFVSTFSPDLTTLEASTFVNGCIAGGEEVLNVMADPFGDVVVTGTTYSGLFPTTPGAYRETDSFGISNIFVSRFDAQLTTMEASTLFGAFGGNYLTSSVLDPAGNVWMTGVIADAHTFPTTPGAYCEDMNSGIFISELSRDLAADPPCGHHGDVSFNGEVTVRDAQLAYATVLGSWVPLTWQQCAADCDGDGVVSFGDVQQIFAAALLQGQCSEAVPAAGRIDPAPNTQLPQNPRRAWPGER